MEGVQSVLGSRVREKMGHTRAWRGLFLILTVILLCCGKSLCRETRVVTTEYPPFSMVERGEVTGLSTRIVTWLLDRLQEEAIIESYPWSRAYKMALEQPNTIIYPLVRTAERENLFEWIGVVARGASYFYSLRGREDIAISSIEDARHLYVGVLRNAVRDRYLRNQGFTRLVDETTTEASARKLLLGWIDLWAVDETTAYYQLEKLGYVPQEVLRRQLPLDIGVDGFVAVTKGSDRVLVERLRMAFQQLQFSGEYEKMVAPIKPTSGNSSLSPTDTQ